MSSPLSMCLLAFTNCFLRYCSCYLCSFDMSCIHLCNLSSFCNLYLAQSAVAVGAAIVDYTAMVPGSPIFTRTGPADLAGVMEGLTGQLFITVLFSYTLMYYVSLHCGQSWLMFHSSSTWDPWLVCWTVMLWNFTLPAPPAQMWSVRELYLCCNKSPYIFPLCTPYEFMHALTWTLLWCWYDDNTAYFMLSFSQKILAFF